MATHQPDHARLMGPDKPWRQAIYAWHLRVGYRGLEVRHAVKSAYIVVPTFCCTTCYGALFVSAQVCVSKALIASVEVLSKHGLGRD